MKLIGPLALASVSVLALSTTAFAQSTEQRPEANNVPGAEANEGFAETDIVVSARRRDESAQDVPLVVNAVTSEELAKLNIREFQEITSAVPGLALSTSANGIGTQATLRGIAYDVNVSGNNGTIEFYLNDAPTSSAIVFQTLFDVSQIELLRGPQGTLRGRAAPSGSMTIVTRRPDLDEVGGYASLTGTTRNAINSNAAFNLPIVRDVLAVRVAGVYEENDGNRVERINPVSGARDGVSPYVKTMGVRASVRFDPMDNLSFNASYLKSVRTALQYDQVESANLANPVLGASPLLVRASDRLGVEATPRRFRQDFDVFNWQAEFRFAGQRLNYVGSYNKQRYTTADPLDKGAFFLTNSVGYFTSFPPATPPIGLSYPAYARLSNDTVTIATQQSHELRISSDERLFGVFDYVLGGLLLKSDSNTNIVTNTPLFNLFSAVNPQIPAGIVVPTVLNTSGTRRPQATDEKSVFFNLTAHLGERTEISGGLRYIHFIETASLSVDQTGAGVFVDQPIARRPRPGEEPEQTVIYSASVKHRFSDSFMAYASFGTSWRPGSTTNAIIAQFARVPLVSPLTQFLNVPPETSQSYEVGFKSNLLDRRLRLNATAFLQNFKNYAYQAPNVIAQTGPTSVATLTPGLTAGVPVQVKGVEAELAWNTSRFSAAVSITYTDSNIKNGVIPCNVGAPAVGDIFPLCTVNFSASNLAPLSATLQAEYNVPVSGSMDGYVRGLSSIFGDSDNSPSNPFDQVSAYALVNLYAGIRDPKGAWDVGLFVKNLFDVERVTNRNENAYAPSYQNFLGATGSSSYRGITTTPAREFGLNVRYAFGSR